MTMKIFSAIFLGSTLILPVLLAVFTSKDKK